MESKPILTDGTYRYYNKNRLLHREDGPALVFRSGAMGWFINGLNHRIDGPAIEYHNGKVEYALNGRFYQNREDWFSALTQEQKDNYIWQL